MFNYLYAFFLTFNYTFLELKIKFGEQLVGFVSTVLTEIFKSKIVNVEEI
jgi:hypothetical protein